MENISAFNVLQEFLKHENFKVDYKELKFQLLSHPSYPSLHSITAVLTHFGIDTIALQVPTDLNILEQMPDSFITLDKHHRYLVASKKENVLSIFNERKFKSTLLPKEFISNWSGIVVALEEDEKKLVNQPKNEGAFLSRIGNMGLVLLVLALFLFSKPSWFQTLHFALSLVGLIISILILRHEFGFQSKVVEEVCSGTESTSCDEVLNSKGARFFDFLKLSDLSIIYFLALSAAWLFTVVLKGSNTAFIGISSIAIPVALYSIYYQYKVVEKWCPLCLGVVAVLILQFCSLLLSNSAPTDFFLLRPLDGLILLSSFVFMFSFWVFVKPLLQGEQEAEKLRLDYYKFKRNFDLFNAVFDKKPSLNITIPEIQENEILLGNIDAPLTLLLITSPGCRYCRAAHTDIENILRNHPNEVKAIIRFSVYSENKNDMSYRVAARMLQLYDLESAEIVEKALHEVYVENADLKAWLSKWGENTLGAYDGILETQQKWCFGNGIALTPSLYVQNKKFPSEYKRTDLSFFIEDLIEQTATITQKENKETKKLTSA